METEVFEIDLLSHSKYDQEQLIKNKEFCVKFIDKITETYEAIIGDNYNCGDKSIINLKRKGKIPTLFFKINGKGIISFNTRILSFKTNYSELMGSKDNYDVKNWGSSEYNITIGGITSSNFNNYLGDIVHLIERQGFNLRR